MDCKSQMFVLIVLCFVSCSYAFEQNGMTYTNGKYCPNITFSHPSSQQSLIHLRSTGANAIAIVVTWYQDNENTTDIYPLYEPVFSPDGYFEYKTAKDEDVEFVVQYAQKLGFQVMLKPHIDPVYVPRYVWRGWIGQSFTNDQVDSWFSSYRNFIIKYAKIAEKYQTAMFSISCELVNMSPHDSHWRQIVKEVRDVYKGALVDAANWGGEEVKKTWWDEMDYIGVDAYYQQLTGQRDITLDEIIEAWQPIVQDLEKLSTKFNKPLIFSEVGYCPWNCTRYLKPTLDDQNYQALYYEALFKVFSDKEWFKGVYWWNWNTDSDFGGIDNECMDPKFKPSEQILRKYYGGGEMPPKPEKQAQCLCTL